MGSVVGQYKVRGAPGRTPVAENRLTRDYVAVCKISTIFEETSEVPRLVISRAISGIHIN